MIGTTEIIIIAGVVVVLFGSSALPKFARAIGKARKEFEKGVDDSNKIEDETDRSEDEELETTGSPRNGARKKSGSKK